MKFHRFFKYIFYFYLILSSNQALSNDNLDYKIKKLTLELRCMTCQNQSVYDSDSDYAKDIMRVVEEKFNEGLDEKEIKYFLTERYGEYILFKPYFSSKNLLLWLFPFILIIASMLVFIRNLKKK
jgi:cytochrome c-type biogenesis protein CcmH